MYLNFKQTTEIKLMLSWIYMIKFVLFGTYIFNINNLEVWLRASLIQCSITMHSLV